MFTIFYDEETMTLLNANRIHSFMLASKLHNKDFPLYKDILHLSPKKLAPNFASYIPQQPAANWG